MESKVKIIIVEDEKSWQEDLRASFEEEGHEVLACLDKREGAFDIIKKHQPDLILIDIELKDGAMAGIELAQDLISLKIPFVYLTQHFDSDKHYNKAHTETPDPLDFRKKLELSIDYHEASQNITRLIKKLENKQSILQVKIANQLVFKHQILYIAYKAMEGGGGTGQINVYCTTHLSNPIKFVGKLKDYENMSFLDRVSKQALVNIENIINIKRYENRGKHKLYFRTRENQEPVITSIEGGKRIHDKWKNMN